MFGTTRAVTSSCENANEPTDVPTGSRNCICNDPSPNKTGCSLTMVSIRKLGKENSFPSLFSRFFFMENVNSLSVLLKLFSFILVCTLFELNILFQKRSSLDIFLKFTTKTSIWILVALADMSACALCISVCKLLSSFFFMLFRSSVGTVKSYLIMSGLFSFFLPSQSIYQFGRSLLPHCVSSFCVSFLVPLRGF